MYHLPCRRGHDRHRNADSRSDGDAHCDAHSDAYACSRLFRDAGLGRSAWLGSCYAYAYSRSGDAYACLRCSTV